MHELIASPSFGDRVVVRPGSPHAIKVPRSKYLELRKAEGFPSWLVKAARTTWDLDLSEEVTAGLLLVRPEVEYPFGKATYELNLGCNYDYVH
jgi:hypothetical protein